MSLNLFDVPDVDYRYEASLDVVFQPALTGTHHVFHPGLGRLLRSQRTPFSSQSTPDRSCGGGGGYPGLKANLADSDANNTRNTYCVNNFAHSIFRDINMSMNGVLMTEQSNTYHYRAYLETLLITTEKKEPPS